ncbi:hypothetical protein [Maricaulis sp. MIT060901]|uniref:hypothetical protein n=1 Tax=Maricaulis sp. MIT060901 TaxID=3096993 RepID=UPI00399AC13B
MRTSDLIALYVASPGKHQVGDQLVVKKRRSFLSNWVSMCGVSILSLTVFPLLLQVWILVVIGFGLASAIFLLDFLMFCAFGYQVEE